MFINTTAFLVISIGSFLSSLFPTFIKYVHSRFFRDTKRLREIRVEMLNIRAEMSQISMMDEFARHARLQRKLIKLESDLKQEKSSVSSSQLGQRGLITVGTALLKNLFMLILLYMYRSEAVVILPEEWLVPFSSIISWPAQETGAVSGLSWIAICVSVSKLVT